MRAYRHRYFGDGIGFTEEEPQTVWGTVSLVSMAVLLGAAIGVGYCLTDHLPVNGGSFGEASLAYTRQIILGTVRVCSDLITGSLSTADGMMLTTIVCVVLGGFWSAFRRTRIYAL